MAYKIPASIVSDYQIEAHQQTFQLQHIDGTEETRPGYIVHTLRLEILTRDLVDSDVGFFSCGDFIVFEILAMRQQFKGHIIEHMRDVIRNSIRIVLRGVLEPLEVTTVGVCKVSPNEPRFKYHRHVALDD